MFEGQTVHPNVAATVFAQPGADALHTGKTAGSPALTPLDLVIEDVLATNEPAAARAEVLIRASSPAHLVVGCDARSLLHLIDLLVHRAVTFAPEGSVVSLAVTSERTAAVIRVWNEGCGPAPDGFAARSYFALGLRLARFVAERHGGSLTSWERASGRGTVFKLSLPLARARQVGRHPRRGDRPCN